MKVILGAGIGGLSAAYYLRKKFADVIIKLYESASTTGGWIKSKKIADSTIFELGPRTLRPTGEAGSNTLKLLDDLGLSKEITPILASQPAAKNRMIYCQGKLHTLPSNIQDFFKTHKPFSKPLFSYLLNDLKAESVRIEDESIYSFVERRFGKELADYAISPLICGICAGNAKEISVKFLMKSIFEKEQKYGGVVKGTLYDIWENGLPTTTRIESSLVNTARNEKWNVYSFKNGMETLPNKLVKVLSENDVDLMMKHKCDKIDFIEDSALISIDGYTQEYICDNIISSIPAYKLAELIVHQHHVLAGLLKDIPTVNVAVVNLHYDKSVSLPQAFGFLVPPSEELPILGVIFDSCHFPSNHKGSTLTAMMGGHWFNKYFGDNPKDEYILDVAIQQVKNILNITAEPTNSDINILHNCIPQYVVGHYERVKKIEDYIKEYNIPLSLCGASYYGVGINDVILSAKNAVGKIKKHKMIK